jgi:hypothetical protein
VDLERGPLSIVSTIEELAERKSSGSGLENRDYGRRGYATLTTRHPFIRKKLSLTSPTGGGRSVGIVRSRTQATEFYIINYDPKQGILIIQSEWAKQQTPSPSLTLSHPTFPQSGEEVYGRALSVI